MPGGTVVILVKHGVWATMVVAPSTRSYGTGGVQLRSDTRHVRWHSADVNPEAAVTLLCGDVIISTGRKY
jgi:hypothetical protein